MKKIFCLLIIIFIFFELANFSFGEEGADKNFIVQKGQSVFQIAKNLENNEIIKSPILFLIYSAFSGHFSDIQSGVYKLSRGMSAKRVMKKFLEGPNDIEAVIYPGMTLVEIDERLSELGVIKKGEILSAKVDDFKKKFGFLQEADGLEGFLMPDTYYFHADSNSEGVVEKILSNFKLKTENIFGQKDNILKIINKASLIEKEVIFEDDKKVVSGIIDSRISLGMALQIDAALVYGICGERFSKCHSLSRSDYFENFPFNTYSRKGLPPAPISNPSVDSIIAAMKPKKTSYLYYLSDPKTKKTIFSRTLDEHNEMRAKYLEL